ncbi:hypothetical protein [Methanonatronarchaeum sp. AMET-Sl]|uniref:hypothetical protein n=1 Tax=Methanonatronarchaeum sp. AMET-Sl TaxID=3037654 RepID=UPI00244D9BFE|nr:hypothetical protein [Methanonatronarchaeum sp. AMET-Sl]WGI17704.1 hypothetical protein QEN48_01465 [Methanonatronarchaeum sp. AMET-Sl]
MYIFVVVFVVLGSFLTLFGIYFEVKLCYLLGETEKYLSEAINNMVASKLSKRSQYKFKLNILMPRFVKTPEGSI